MSLSVSRTSAATTFFLALILSVISQSHANAGRIYDPSSKSYVEYRDVASPYRKVPERFARQTVRYQTEEKAGTIIIDTRRHYLYYVLGEDQAIRYGVGLGRIGFGWTGEARIRRKQSWPTWTPTKAMIERIPGLSEYSSGMPGGPDNPLGARALYLFEGGRDTLYRIHGTNEPWSIGLNVSSGCIRMNNDDVIHLYKKARAGTKVIIE